MKPFEEYCFGNDYILRFYRVDHGLVCTINESMVPELREVASKLTKYELRHAEQRKRIAELEAKIERMIENASHHEGITHAGGFEQGYEAGRKTGMQQERALWELAASTQEIEK